MARVGSINYQVAKVIKIYNGIHQSKRERRNESNLVSVENGHKVSDKFHSYKSLDNVRANLTNLAKFAKLNHQVKNISKIDINIVRNWILNKNITYDTASNYFSELHKVHEYFSFNREEIKNLRADIKKTLKSSETKYETRYYKNLEKVILPVQTQPAFELQRDHGLRVSASTFIDIDKQLNGNILTYREKGGKLAQKELSNSLVSKIQDNAFNNIYQVNNRTYSRHLEKAIITQTKNKFNGTHGIRHTYAQNQLELGKTKLEVSKELGHVREEIIHTYLR